MADKEKVCALKCLPGVQRDGTAFLADSYIDSQHCRWYGSTPKKMGGFKKVINLNQIPTATYVVPNSPNFNVYTGDYQGLGFTIVNRAGDPIGGFNDRTPINFAANVNNIWTFNRLFSATNNASVLLAHAAPNMGQIDSPVEEPIWIGDVNSTTPLVTTGINVSGGFALLGPYLFGFGNDGQVLWSVPNNPTQISDSGRPIGEKIVALYPSRGGNSSPAGIMWGLSTVLRITHTGQTLPEFTFDIVSDDSSILSSRSVVEYDGRYYWPGHDRFLIYTGIVQQLPNTMVLNYFFDSLDLNQRQKVWGTKIPRWGEIHWHFPNKTLEGYSGECNDTIVFNINENVWYTTQINRSSGFTDATFGFPLWTDTSVPSKLWMHEKGVDQEEDGNLSIIPSWFETRVMSWPDKAVDGDVAELDRWLFLTRLEPDFRQSGNMFLIVNGRTYAEAPVQSSTRLWDSYDTQTWDELTNFTWDEWGEYSFGPQAEVITFKEQRRLLTLRFVSAVLGGDYHMGKILLTVGFGDARQ